MFIIFNIVFCNIYSRRKKTARKYSPRTRGQLSTTSFCEAVIFVRSLNIFSKKIYIDWGGGSTPFLPMEKCVISHFSHGEKSIWKEREMNTFPFLSIYFFPHFSPWGKMGKHTFFHGQKWGWTPPPLIDCRYNSQTTVFVKMIGQRNINFNYNLISL